jgi:hypothetical protein
LTPVIPIVFHTGSSEWSSNRRLADLFEGPEALRAFAPEWPVMYWDLAARTPEELLASDGPFTQFLAIVRAENADTERFRQVFMELAERLEPVAGQDKMRWQDLLWLMLSWVLQRRPDDEGEALSRALAEKQHDLALREEVQTMSEATKQTWVQKVEARAAIRSLREVLIEMLSEKYGELPEPLLTSIQTCEDVGRLKAGVKHLNNVTALDQFQF